MDGAAEEKVDEKGESSRSFVELGSWTNEREEPDWLITMNADGNEEVDTSRVADDEIDDDLVDGDDEDGISHGHKYRCADERNDDNGAIVGISGRGRTAAVAAADVAADVTAGTAAAALVRQAAGGGIRTIVAEGKWIEPVASD